MATGDEIAEPSANPYPGPRPFEAGEKLYGRDQEVTRLFYLLSAERIVVLHSPSGAGKSSLLNARLVPKLRAERFYVWPTIRLGEQPTADGNRFVNSAVSSLEAGLPKERRRPAAKLARLSLAEYIDGRPRREGAPVPVVLVFDQFEEILTLDPLDLDARREFFRQLGEALENPGVWALFALREDYLGALDPYRHDVPTRLGNTFRLDLLTLAAAEDAIAGPAHDAGRDFAPGAALELATDLATLSVQQPDGSFEKETGIYVEPLLLQVVCTRVWELTAGVRTIGKHNLPESGDVDAALAEYYDRRVGEVADGTIVSERAIREWFDKQLIGRGGIRSQVQREQWASGGLDENTIDRLVKTHLVRAELRGERTWFELAHDRLVAPVRKSNTAWFRERLHPMQRQAALWSDEHEPQGLLLRGRDLKEAEAWARDNAASMLPVETDFLERSQKQRRAERQKRAMVIVGAVIALAVAAVIGLLALKASSEQHKAQRAAARAESQAWSGEVSGLLPKRLDDAMLLALAARERSPTVEARGALLGAVQRTEGLVRFLRFGEPVNSLAVARNGTIAVALEGGKLALLDRHGRNVRETPISTKHFSVDAVAFDPARPRLAAAVTNEVELFRTRRDHTLEPLGKGTTTQQLISSISFSNDGRWLAAGGAGGLALWRVDSAGHLRAVRIRGAAADVTALAFDGARPKLVASGARGLLTWDLRHPGAKPVPVATERAGALAVGPYGGAVARRGRAYLWHGSPNARFVPVDRVGGSPTSLGLNGDNSLLAVGDASGRVSLWAVKQRRPVGPPLLGQDGKIVSVAFEPGGSVVAAASAENTVALWDTDSRVRALRVSRAFGSEVGDALFDGDGNLVAVTKGRALKMPDLGRTGGVHVVPHLHDVAKLVGSPDGRGFAVVDNSGALTALNSGMDQNRALPIPFPKYVSVANDGSGVAVTGIGETVQLWHAKRRSVEQLQPPDEPNVTWSPPLPAAISADGKTVVAYYTGPRKLVLWRLTGTADPKGTVLGSLPRGTNVEDLAFSRDGELLGVASDDGTIEVLPVRKPGSSTKRVAGAAGPTAIAFAPAGGVAASATGNTIRLWTVQKGLEELGSLTLSGGPVTSIAFSPDGHRLVVVQNGKIHLWDATLWGQTEATLDDLHKRFCGALWSDNRNRELPLGAGNPCR